MSKVTMYAQWASMEAYQAMRENPVAIPFLPRLSLPLSLAHIALQEHLHRH
jgi:hypothetical protein